MNSPYLCACFDSDRRTVRDPVELKITDVVAYSSVSRGPEDILRDHSGDKECTLPDEFPRRCRMCVTWEIARPCYQYHGARGRRAVGNAERLERKSVGRSIAHCLRFATGCPLHIPRVHTHAVRRSRYEETDTFDLTVRSRRLISVYPDQYVVD